ncbi:MAG: hypothetical protein ACLTBF_06790, partial [Christensenellales bacterium]
AQREPKDPPDTEDHTEKPCDSPPLYRDLGLYSARRVKIPAKKQALSWFLFYQRSDVFEYRCFFWIFSVCFANSFPDSPCQKVKRSL